MRIITADWARLPMRESDHHGGIVAATAGATVAGKSGILLLLAFFCSLAFMRPQLDLFGLAVVPSDGLAVAVGLAWLASIVSGHRTLRWHFMFGLFASYYCAMVISAALADAAFQRFMPRLAGEAYLIALPIIIMGLLEDQEDLRLACLGWLSGTGTVIILGVVALLTTLLDATNPLLPFLQHHYGSLPLGPFIRFKLAYENPNMLGAYLSASLMVVLLAQSVGWIQRWVAIAYLAGISLVLVMTFSAGIGGALLAGGIWIWLRQREKRNHLASALLWLGIASGVAFVVAQSVTPVAYPDPAFALHLPGTDLALFPSSRMRVWSDAIATFAANPLTGNGIGRSVAHVLFTEPGGAHVLLLDAHNVLLNLAAECGIIGAAAICAIMFGVWRLAHPSPQATQLKKLAQTAFAIGILDVLAYQGLGGSFEDARFVWAMMGLLLAASRLPNSTFESARSVGQKDTSAAFGARPL